MQDDEFGRSLVAVAGYGVVALNPLLVGDGAGQASEQRHGEAKARAMAALALRAQYDGKHRSVGSGALLGVMLRPVTIYIEENRRVQPTGTAVAYGGSSPGCDSRDDSTKVPAGQDDTATAWSGMMPRGVVKNPLSVCSLERTDVRMDSSVAGRGQSQEGAAGSAEVIKQAQEHGQKRRLSGSGPAGAAGGALLGVLLRPVTIYIEENRRVQPTGTAVAYGGSSPGCDSRDDSTKVPAGQDDTATAWSGMMPRGVVKNPLSVCSLERTEVRMDESGAGRGQSHEGAARSAEVMGQALEQGQKRRLSGCGPAGAEAVAKEIDAVHRKKRERLGEFDSDRERTEVKVEREVAALVALMPEQVREHILGGPRGMQQVPGREAQDAIIRRMLKTRAGSDGANVANARLALGTMRKYAAVVMGLPEGERDCALFPMTATLAHELIHRENKRAIDDAKGKQNGASVGPRFRDTLIFMAEKLRWPIEPERVMLQGAAPKAKAGGVSEKAGTLPLAFKIHLEMLANGTTIPEGDGHAKAAVKFYARSILAANLDQSIRVGEGIRVELFPDEDDVDGVMRGIAWMGKDGAPVNLYAPAEGILGRYEWYREHLEDTLRLGQVYPLWVRPRNSKGCITKAGPLKAKVAGKEDVRAALKAIMKLAPLAYTEEEIAEWALRGHSLHASLPDWARAIGVDPNFSWQLPEQLKGGFVEQDVGALGLWLRDEGAKREASAEQAARDVQGRESRRAAAVANLRGRPAVRGQMQNYYGMAGTVANRWSERFVQLRVRQRLAHTLREIVTRAGGMASMLRGPADIRLLQSMA